MKVKQFVASAVLAIGVLGAGAAAYAAGSGSPAEIVAGLTGQSVQAVTEQRSAGTTYGAIAASAGVLSDFQQQMLEQKKSILDQRVADGKLTQPEADEIYQRIKDNQANCDGTGAGCGLGGQRGLGLGFGGKGQGQGTCAQNGAGRGFGQGRQR